jgi:hypothetical protein
VSYLRGAALDGTSANGWLTQIDLATGVQTRIDLGPVPARTTVYDRAQGRLHVTGRYAGILSYDPWRWLDLTLPGSGPSALNLFPFVRGSELRSLALSNDGTRAYLGLRIYSVEDALQLGGRPAFDTAGALAVMDVAPGPAGIAPRLLSLVPLDRGVSEVRVLPGRTRAGQPIRDLVAVTLTDDNRLALYDDEEGAVVKVLGQCAPRPDSLQDPSQALSPEFCEPGRAGFPVLGRQPFGLVVDPQRTNPYRLYVGAFDSSWISVVDVPPDAPSAAVVTKRIGKERR